MNIDTVFGYLFTSQTPLAQYSIDHAVSAMSIVWCPICQHILIYTPGGLLALCPVKRNLDRTQENIMIFKIQIPKSRHSHLSAVHRLL